MTKGEYLQKFDTFYNNIASNKAPGFIPEEIEDITNEVLKSLIIELVTNSFEQTEEVRRYLAPLVKTKECAIAANNSLTNYKADISPSTNESNVWYITYEYIKHLISGTNYDNILVVPVKQDSFYKTTNNPFRGPGKYRALRLDTASNIIELDANLTLDTTNDKYVIMYIAEPAKIVLHGTSYNPNADLCDLPETLQTKLLDLVVKKAMTLWDIIK